MVQVNCELRKGGEREGGEERENEKCVSTP